MITNIFDSLRIALVRKISRNWSLAISLSDGSICLPEIRQFYGDQTENNITHSK
jgi:hypothetical protein